jgi:hypothetical protein
MRIEWAQAHGVREICLIAMAGPPMWDSYPTAGVSRSRQVRIEHESAIDKGGGFVKVADDIGERIRAPRERDRIRKIFWGIREFDWPIREPSLFGLVPFSHGRAANSFEFFALQQPKLV